MTSRSPSSQAASGARSFAARIAVTAAWPCSVKAARSLRDSCSAGASPNTFGNASKVATSMTMATSQIFQAG